MNNLYPSDVWKVSWKLSSQDPAKIQNGRERLSAMGVSSEKLVESRTRKGFEFSCYFSNLQEKNAFLKSLIPVQGLRRSVTLLKQKNWAERWKKGIKIFPLTNSFEVVPAWVGFKKNRESPRRAIVIDTNLAFGTGLHETTRFMARLIEEQKGFFSFLDVGTGTGILAIIASFLGAKTIDALEIDPNSIPVARQNLKANHVNNVRIILADIGQWKNAKTYDFVAANLVTQDLIGFGKNLVGRLKSHGLLAVSGISLQKLPKIRKAFAKLPLKELKVLRGKEWSAILYRKTH